MRNITLQSLSRYAFVALLLFRSTFEHPKTYQKLPLKHINCVFSPQRLQKLPKVVKKWHGKKQKQRINLHFHLLFRPMMYFWTIIVSFIKSQNINYWGRKKSHSYRKMLKNYCAVVTTLWELLKPDVGKIYKNKNVENISERNFKNSFMSVSLKCEK